MRFSQRERLKLHNSRLFTDNYWFYNNMLTKCPFDWYDLVITNLRLRTFFRGKGVQAGIISASSPETAFSFAVRSCVDAPQRGRDEAKRPDPNAISELRRGPGAKHRRAPMRSVPLRRNSAQVGRSTGNRRKFAVDCGALVESALPEASPYQDWNRLRLIICNG